MERLQRNLWPLTVWKMSFAQALVSDWLLIPGSLIKVLPLTVLGGKLPERRNFKVSKIVLFPDPFLPSIKVMGEKNSSIISNSY